ncbi:MAG: PSD1 and planctomycete cytochrome C domain-containing protein [Pirellulaceae bacterium]
MNYRLIVIACWALLAWEVADVSAEESAPKYSSEQVEFFESKVRPVLVEHCYECHSADSGADLEGGLLLDSRWGWSTGGDSGPAIIPGDAKESLVMHAVLYQDDVVSAMPPSSKLPAEQIKILEQWIRDGAADPREKVGDGAKVEAFDFQERFDQHWSWRQIQKPDLPAITNKDWPHNFIDRFVLSKLESAGIAPAVAADKAIWLRRVYFDLTGLPPTLAQIDSFLADDSEMAREKVVTDLLQSDHFGEKWARHWMDSVRYAETYGHEFDYPIPHATEYRDYIIRAFNADVPYDQLIREHIAGDLMEEPRLHPSQQYNESVIGTGFWYLHEATHAPTDVLKNESDIIDNQLDVFGKTFLGLTVACARCHDHKFDAISTADYYALSGYIQSSCRQLYPLDPDRKIENGVQRLRALQPKFAAARIGDKRLFDDQRGPSVYVATAVKLIGATSMPSKEQIATAATVSKLDDGILSRWVDGLQKANPAIESDNLLDVIAYRIKNSVDSDKATKKLQEIAKKRAEYDGTLLADFNESELPAGWSVTGDAFQVVSEQSKFIPIGGQPSPVPGTVDSAAFGKTVAGTLRSPTFNIPTRNIHVRMRATAGAKVRLIIDNYQMATFSGLLFKGTNIENDASDTKGRWIWKSLGNDLRKYVGHNAYLEFVDSGEDTIAVDEIWFSDHGPPLATTYFGDAVMEFWENPAAGWESLHAAYRQGIPNRVVSWLSEHDLVDGSLVGDEVKRIESEAASIAKSIPSPKYVLAMAQGTVENAHVYVRGNSAMLGEELPPRNLQALGGHVVGRLELANEIASLDNPLTARVMVNRLWHHLFGRGIVPTTDDFGPQGQPASHPELLDALAVDFAESGWSIKHALRNIVLSQTYAQSSTTNPTNDAAMIANVDPTNSLLHCMPIRRLPAESIRDQILAVSGQLDDKQFGGSVPTYRTPFMTGRGARASGPRDGEGRRSVYLAVYRNFLNPFMSTFDVPNPFGPLGRRSVSNVPAQSLTLLNDPFVIEQADLWVKKLIDKEQSAEERIIEMVRTAHGVELSDPQVQRLAQFVKEHPEAGKNEQQVWAELAHALMNMKAFYFLR